MNTKPPLVIRTWVRNPAYWTGIPSLVVFNLALIGFALTPVLPEPNPLLLVEIVISTISAIAIILLVCHMADKILNIARFAFLTTIFSTCLVLLGFVVGENENASLALRLDILLFLLTGLLIAISMHIVYGGR